MSSTNVHSNSGNTYCAGAQMIPTEREVEIPPKNAHKGPSSREVKLGEGMEILVENSILHEDGKLTTINGKTLITTFPPKAYSAIKANKRDDKNTKNVKRASEGEGR